MAPDFFKMSGLVIIQDQEAMEKGIRSIMRTLIEEEMFQPTEVQQYILMIVQEAMATELNNIRREQP